MHTGSRQEPPFEAQGALDGLNQEAAGGPIISWHGDGGGIGWLTGGSTTYTDGSCTINCNKGNFTSANESGPTVTPASSWVSGSLWGVNALNAPARLRVRVADAK